VPDSFVRIFERIDLNYKLPEPVINVLIHYVFDMKHAQRLTHGFIDSIASNMLAKGIDTFERAIAYMREQQKLNESLERRRKGEDAPVQGTGSRGGKTKPRSKPSMPGRGGQRPSQDHLPGGTRENVGACPAVEGRAISQKQPECRRKGDLEYGIAQGCASRVDDPPIDGRSPEAGGASAG
jgi:hypothetical protein